jgi:hypothetical protein
MRSSRPALWLVSSLALVLVLAAGCVTPTQWRHYVLTVQPGTRSEGKAGVLAYGGTEVMPYFLEVVTPLGGYVYEFRPHLWSEGGWVKHAAAKPAKLDEAVTNDELQRGWYTCEGPSVKAGTPSEWFWIPSLNTWVDPAKLADFVGLHYSHDGGWTYEIVMTNKTDWRLEGQLTRKGEQVPAADEPVETPFGTYRWLGGGGGESGWFIQEAAAPAE